MKICFVNSLAIWGGGERWHLEHARFMAERGHDVTVCTAPGGELARRAAASGLRVVERKIGNLSFLNPFTLVSVCRFLRRGAFDAVLVNSPRDLRLYGLAAHLVRVPKVVFRRGSDIPIRHSLLNRYLFGTCVTHFIANSHATRASLLAGSHPLMSPDRITVIYNGIDLSPYADLTETPSGNEVPVVGILGRLSRQKRHDVFLAVAAELRRRGVNCRFRIGGSGELEADVRAKCQAMGLSDVVEFTGFVADPPRFMRGIDVFALTSEWEGFGYVLAEAMLSYRPVVAFAVSSNPEIVLDGQTGLLARWPDVADFADKVERLLSDSALSRRLASQGRQRCIRDFGIDKDKTEVERLLSEG